MKAAESVDWESVKTSTYKNIFELLVVLDRRGLLSFWGIFSALYL